MLPHGARPDITPRLGDDLLNLLSQFDRAWQAGAAPRIEEFLGRASDATASRQLLEELIKVDLEYRWRQAAGPDGAQRPRLEDYLSRFPVLGPLERLSAALIEEEYRVRQRWGDGPGHTDYTARFPQHGALLVERLRRIDAELAGREPGGNPAF